MKISLFQNSSDTPLGGVAGAGEAPQSDAHFEAEFQKLKTRIHRELIDSLDLSRIGTLDEPHLRAHIRNLAEGLLRSRPVVCNVGTESKAILGA